MSILDDARQILHGIDPSCQGQGRCTFCYRLLEPITSAGIEAEPHAPTCPWLAMPGIVAALEAAERVASTIGRGRHACNEGCPCQFRAVLALRAALKDEPT